MTIGDVSDLADLDEGGQTAMMWDARVVATREEAKRKAARGYCWKGKVAGGWVRDPNRQYQAVSGGCDEAVTACLTLEDARRVAQMTPGGYVRHAITLAPVL